MFQCCSLYSGSSGNCFLVSTEKANILIDAGVSCKKILDALALVNKNINNIDAILITHEHIDHTKGLPVLSSKYHIPIFATKKTWNMINQQKINNSCIKYFEIDSEFLIKDLNVLPFSTPHDAVDPCGFKISKNGKAMCIATDLGYITQNVYKHFTESSMLMLESNYDPDILKVSSYPYNLKERIKGNFGHLSNISAGETISSLAKNNLKKALLIHLSQENNIPEIALTTINEELSKNDININNIDIDVAPRNGPSKFFNVS